MVTVHDSGDTAHATCKRLIASGFPAFSRDVSAVQQSPVWTAARGFSLSAEGIRWHPSGVGEPFPMRWSDIHLIVRGTRVTVTESVETVKQKSFSVTRAVATSGIVRNKTVKTEQSRTEQQREGFIHVYERGGRVAIIGEQSMDYAGLGDLLERSRSSNFLVLLKVIRQRAPGADIDERLLTHAGQANVLSGRLDPSSYLKLASGLIAGALHLGLSDAAT